VAAGGDIALEADGRVALLSGTDTAFRQYKGSRKSAVWQSAQDTGETSETVVMTELEAGGTLSVAAGAGVVADYRDTGGLQTSLAALAQDPATAWVAEIAGRDDVQWRAVQEHYDSWNYRSQGLTGPAAAVIAIAVAVATQGYGVQALGAMGVTGLSGTAAAMVNAGFSALVSQASVSAINNQGNLGKVLQDLGSSASLRNLAISMAAAGAFYEVGTLTDGHFTKAGETLGGKTPEQYFASANHLRNVIGHALVGCAAGAAGGESCGSGAAAAGFGAGVSPVALMLNQRFPGMGIVTTSAVGGISSELSGGSFGNGAWTSALGFLFNDLACDADKKICSGVRPTKEEIDAHYQDGTGWPVYAETMDPSWLNADQFLNIPVGQSGQILTNWPNEVFKDSLPWIFGNYVGDRDIYGSFAAIRVSNNSFLWKDNYGFEMHSWNEPIRNVVTFYGMMKALNWDYSKVGTAKPFDIYGEKPVNIPGN